MQVNFNNMKWSIIVVAAICQKWIGAAIVDMGGGGRRTCVVGAGVAGLSAARYLAAAGQHVSVIEATAHIGGMWRYEPRVGHDENGRPIRTSMYKNLRTNLPKQTMELPGYPMPEETPSFPSSELYYEYLKSFAEHFDLKKYIKFLHEVTSITRVGDQWKVKYRNIVSGEEFQEDYDYVIIGSGHESKPNMPTIPGEKLFKGTIMHSHDFRETEPFRGRRVLVVGGGPSGMEIGLELAANCSRLVHSHHVPVKFRTPFPSNYIAKSDVKQFTEGGVIFKDGSFEEIDDVVYCTGYALSYPFLDSTSGLDVQPGSVTPLHQNTVNIHQPTMLLVGLAKKACLIVAIDAQARYAAALVSGQFSLQPEQDMLREWQRRADELRSRGRRLADLHVLWNEENQYYANLTAESGIERVPPVLAAIRRHVVTKIIENYYTYRDYTYSMLDEHHFTTQYRPRPPLLPPTDSDHDRRTEIAYKNSSIIDTRI